MKKTDKTVDKIADSFFKENRFFVILIGALKMLAPIVIIIFLGLTLFLDFSYWKHTVFSIILYFPFIYILTTIASIVVNRWLEKNRSKVEEQTIDDLFESKEDVLKFMEEIRAEAIKKRQNEKK